ncbi:MAG: zinc-finger-containing protein [Clostridia bacterium]|nr:zinc-finger-containing protein [Clostridia bacterium]
MIVWCDYCGKRAEFVDSSIVYGRSYGMIYCCRECGAWVGVHKGTDKPLGRLANLELRELKKAAHNAFDPIWKHGQMTRRQAYACLSEQIGLVPADTHIGMFDVDRCKQTIRICNDERRRKFETNI